MVCRKGNDRQLAAARKRRAQLLLQLAAERLTLMTPTTLIATTGLTWATLLPPPAMTAVSHPSLH